MLDKNALRRLAFALIILGFLLIIVALLGTSITYCPANGCPNSASPLMGVFVFFSGIALVMIGIILLIVARSMKPKQEVDTAITPTASS